MNKLEHDHGRIDQVAVKDWTAFLSSSDEDVVESLVRKRGLLSCSSLLAALSLLLFAGSLSAEVTVIESPSGFSRIQYDKSDIVLVTDDLFGKLEAVILKSSGTRKYVHYIDRLKEEWVEEQRVEYPTETDVPPEKGPPDLAPLYQSVGAAIPKIVIVVLIVFWFVRRRKQPSN